MKLRVPKPWGYEIILTSPESFVTGKILHLNKGCRFSLQYHGQKEETLILVNGEALLIIENGNGELKEIRMEKEEGYLVKPNQKHRVKGITDADVFEVSTRETGNTIRLEDDYSRGTETEEERLEERKKL